MSVNLLKPGEFFFKKINFHRGQLIGEGGVGGGRLTELLWYSNGLVWFGMVGMVWYGWYGMV